MPDSTNIARDGYEKTAPGQLPESRSRTLSVANVIEIVASSPESFDDAFNKGINRAGKTLENVRSAWVKDLKLVVEEGKATEYRVTMNVSFVVED